MVAEGMMGLEYETSWSVLIREVKCYFESNLFFLSVVQLWLLDMSSIELEDLPNKECIS